MLNLFLKWVTYALIIIFTAWIIPGIEIESFWSAMIVAAVMALINTFIKPFLEIISFPLTILTLGLFTLVLNAILFMLASIITSGFIINGFLPALLGSIILSIFTVVIKKF